MVEPGDGALDNAALREHDELAHLGSLGDLEVEMAAAAAQSGLTVGALVPAVGVEFQQEGVEPEHLPSQQHTTIAVLDVGGVDDSLHQQALGVDEDVPLLALDLLACIVARGVDAAPPFPALFMLWLSMIAAVGLASRSACSWHSA